MRHAEIMIAISMSTERFHETVLGDYAEGDHELLLR